MSTCFICDFSEILSHEEMQKQLNELTKVQKTNVQARFSLIPFF